MQQRAALDALKRHKRFIVTMHVNPDPDAVASALAMTLFLRSQGKQVRLVNQDECPKWLDFVPRIGLYEKFDLNRHRRFRAEVMVVLDCGTLERTGRVAELAGDGVKVLNVDHHVTNERFGDWNCVRADWSSTSELLYVLLKSAGCRFTRDIAVLLYLGIMTDTGSFGFDCTGTHTHKIVAELLRFGFSVSEFYGRVYETMPAHDFKRFFAIMNRMEIHFRQRVACLVTSQKEVDGFSADFDLKDKIFTFLRGVKGLEVIVILTDQGPRKTRLNFRSRDAVDVARLAARFGGGGHKKASGGFLDCDAKKAKSIVLSAIRKVL